MLVQGYVRRRFPALTREEHNDVTQFTCSFIGFLVSAMWGQINTAASDARAEGAAAVQLATDAGAFEPADKDGIRQSLLAYEQAILAEWVRYDTSRSAEADTALAGMYTAYGRIQANTDTQQTRLATSYANLDKISQARTTRILEPMVAIVGVIVAANLFVRLELSHAYLGEVSTSSDPLQEAVWVLSQPAAWTSKIGPGRGDGDLGCPPCRSTAPRLRWAASASRPESRSSSTRGGRTDYGATRKNRHRRVCCCSTRWDTATRSLEDCSPQLRCAAKTPGVGSWRPAAPMPPICSAGPESMTA